MDGLDIQASLHNLSQMDRHQQDGHRTPMVHQQQNAEMARDEAGQRIEKPVEADEAEGKTVDPEDRRRRDREGRKKKNQERKSDTGKDKGSTGRFIDFSV